MPLAGPIIGLCACAGIIVGVICSATVIAPGYVGVVTFLGNAYEQPLYPGMSFINPLSSVTKLNTQTQIFHFSDNVPTMEGVNVFLEANCLMHLDAAHAVEVFRRIGPDYAPVILIPQFQSVVREVTSDHNASALYTADARQNMTTSLREQLSAMTKEFGLVIESTPINKLTLPLTITAAIEKKMTLQQEADSMDFILDKEKQEAHRRIIEAEGIANYQNIISTNTTDGMLRWNAIAATEQISESCNAKIIFLGDKGLPVIQSQKPENDTTPAGVSPNPKALGKLPETIKYEIPAKHEERRPVRRQHVERTLAEAEELDRH